MKKILLSSLIVVSLLLARENPFFPSEGMKDLPISSNIVSKRPQLERAAITLPDSARILKQVTIKYQNLDGSLESKSITLDHNVDWHIPLFISQSYGSSSNTLTKQSHAIKKTPSLQSLTPFVQYALYNKSIELHSNDTVIRDFILVNPHRVVIDFKRNSSERSKTVPLHHAPFRAIKYGNHGTYYRVVIVLDGKYRYNILKNRGIVRISLR